MRVKDISRLRPVAPSMLAAGQTEDGFCQAFLRADRADEFAKAVPDQAQWVTRFAKHFGVVHMHEVMTQVGYDGPGELFSMYLCIFLARPLVERHMPLLTACAQVPGAVSRSRPRCLGVESWQARPCHKGAEQETQPRQTERPGGALPVQTGVVP